MPEYCEYFSISYRAFCFLEMQLTGRESHYGGDAAKALGVCGKQLPCRVPLPSQSALFDTPPVGGESKQEASISVDYSLISVAVKSRFCRLRIPFGSTA